MAISFVGSLPAVGANNGGNVTLSFSNLVNVAGGAATLQQGDLVVCAYMSSGIADAAMSTSSSLWNELHENYANGSANDTNLAVYWKAMGPSPDTQFVAVGPTGNNNATVAVAFAFRGVDTANPIDVFVAGTNAATGTATGRPDPAAITPVAPGAWIIVAGAAAAATGATFTNPGDLSATTNHFRALSHAETIDGMLGVGLKTDWASGAFNPAQWTSGPNNAGDSWCAMTLSIRPFFVASPADVFQGQSVDAATGTPAVAAAASDAAQAQSLDTPSIAPTFVVAVNDAAQAQSEDAPDVAAPVSATPSELAQGQSADAPVPAPWTPASAEDANLGQTSDQPTVAPFVAAAPFDAAQGQGVDAPVLAVTAVVAANDAFQGQTEGAPAIASLVAAPPNDLFQDQNEDQPAVASAVAAAPGDATQEQRADEPLVGGGGAADAEGAEQGQSTDSPPVAASVAAIPVDLAQAQGEDVPALVAAAVASPADAAQGQSEDGPLVEASGSAEALPANLAQFSVCIEATVDSTALVAANDVFQLQTVDYQGRVVTPLKRRAYPRREPRTAVGPRRPNRKAV